MFSRMVISNIKRVLENAGFLVNGELFVIKTNDDFDLVRYISLNDSYIIKFYKNNNKISNYNILEKYGIKTLNYDIVGENIVIFKDVMELDGFRKIENNDFNNENVIRGLAKWYKELHNCDDENLEEFDCFTLDNLKKAIDVFRLNENKALLYICDNFYNISLKYNRIKKCLNYGNFLLENVIVSEDCSEVFMVDFDTLNRGNRYKDIDSVLSKLNQKQKDIFIGEYGKISDDEMIINYVVNSVVKLYLATKEKILPVWVKGVLEDINNDKLYQSAFCLVNWY